MKKRKYYERCSIADMVGKTISQVDYNPDEEEIHFTCTDGVKYKMYHQQDCCEYVSIEDIEGDLQSLVGNVVLRAEERSSNDNPKPEDDNEYSSSTWTFYNIASIGGDIDIRWYGTSNGYYSESADFEKLEPEDD